MVSHIIGKSSYCHMYILIGRFSQYISKNNSVRNAECIIKLLRPVRLRFFVLSRDFDFNILNKQNHVPSNMLSFSKRTLDHGSLSMI